MTEQSVLRLSDAYESKSEELDLELRIRFININPGYNEEIVEKSPTLYQYVKFVDISAGNAISGGGGKGN